ncbi:MULTISPECIES: hypothetical protein [unclassified Arthrobacter]|uniref:hypothetical protein n=1 Tax=unclassified Arthrobacter TaxID=235627 RepID=UPI002882DA1F|nr:MULTISPECIES: hypothetical protein [unclassified Arthrobacter]
MRKSRFALSSVAAAGVVGISLLATAPMASASAGASVTGSYAYYNSASNVLSSQDTRVDGVSSVAQLRYVSNGTTYIATLTNSNGSGTQSQAQSSGLSGTVYVRACLNNRSAGTGVYGCSGWVASGA